MKILNHIIKILFIAASMTMWCCYNASDNELAHHHHDGHESTEHHDDEDDSEHHHGDFEIVLHHEQAEKYGVVVDTVSHQPFQSIVKATGQILSSASNQAVISAKSAGIIHFSKGLVEGKKIGQGASVGYVSARGISGGDLNEANRIAYEAAKRELDRITPLHKEGIVSTKDYNEVKRAYDQAAAAFTGSKAGSSATSPISGVITKLLVNEGEYVEVGQQIAVISKNTQLTLRVDLSERYSSFVPLIKTANVKATSSNEVYSLSEMNGRLVTNAVNNSEGGYVPVYFTFDNNGQFPSGAYVEVFLLGEDSSSVISLPKDAIVEQQGKYYVYVRHDEDCYEKRLVEIGMDNGKDVEIIRGLNDGEPVVVHGAIIIHLAESSGTIPEGHSHNH